MLNQGDWVAGGKALICDSVRVDFRVLLAGSKRSSCALIDTVLPDRVSETLILLALP